MISAETMKKEKAAAGKDEVIENVRRSKDEARLHAFPLRHQHRDFVLKYIINVIYVKTIKEYI